MCREPPPLIPPPHGDDRGRPNSKGAAESQPLPRFIGVTGAGRYTGLSNSSIRRLLASGKLTGLRPVRGRILIDLRELESLMRTSVSSPRGGRGVR